MSLRGKTIFISGASRGIGLAIALRAAQDGANVALMAKTAEPHPKLEGTVYTAAEQIEAAGGQALPIVGDVRDEQQVATAVAQAVDRFGGIDVCVNNASAINLSRTEALDMKRYDLMQDINVRGTFAVSRACIPHLREAENPHILTLSPPISLDPDGSGPTSATRSRSTACRWSRSASRPSCARTGSPPTRCGRGRWSRPPPCRTCSAATRRWRRARKPEIYADAAYAVLTRPARDCTGNAFLCEDVLAEEGVTDLSAYSYVPGAELAVDLFVDAADPPGIA